MKKGVVGASHHTKVVEALNKELPGLGDEFSEKLESVKEEDQDFFHAALVRTQQVPGQLKPDVSVSVQKFHKHAWEKIQKRYLENGFHSVHLLHEPDGKVKALVPKHEDDAAAKKLREEMEKEYEAKLAKQREELQAKHQKELEEATKKDGPEYGTKDYIESLKKDELIAFAKAENVEIDVDANKPVILKVVLEAKFPSKSVKEIGLDVLEKGTDEAILEFAQDYGIDIPEGSNAKDEVSKWLETEV